MARCPKCNENWFWDWCQDTYRYFNGSKVEILEFKYEEQDLEIEIFIFRCKCGSINSVMYNDQNGLFVCSIKKWKNITWEKDGDSWDPKCLNCKDKNCLKEN